MGQRKRVSAHNFDHELQRRVVHDLQYLAESWKGKITEDSVKDESARLRRLLIDQRPTLQLHRKQLGLRGEARIRAIDLRAALADNFSRAIIASAGGARVNSIDLLLPIASSSPLADPPRVPFPTQNYRLSAYLDSPCVVVEGRSVTRLQLIKYVANKLGGVHYDTTRGPKDRAFTLLDNHRQEMYMQGVDLIHFELMAIGQHLLRSHDVARLLPEGSFQEKIPQLDEFIDWFLVEEIRSG